MLQLEKFVVGGWVVWVADTNYLYPACWGWIKMVFHQHVLNNKTLTIIKQRQGYLLKDNDKIKIIHMYIDSW